MNELLSIKEIEEQFKIPAEEIRKAVHSGELERAVATHRIQIRAEQVKEWAAEHERKRRAILPQGNLTLDSNESLRFVDGFLNSKMSIPGKYLTDMLYAVSNKGNIYNVDKRYKLSSSPDTNGYLQTTLSTMTGTLWERIHIITAAMWCPNQKGKPCVHHIDGDKLNNNYLNLVWVNEIEHAEAHKLLNVAKENNDFTAYNAFVQKLQDDNAWKTEYRCLVFPKDNATIFVWIPKDKYELYANGTHRLIDIESTPEEIIIVTPHTLYELTGGKVG